MAAMVDHDISPSNEALPVSSPAVPKPTASPAAPKATASPNYEITTVARKFSDDPVQNPDPSVWAVLTAISANARRRHQGMNILLSKDEHCFGRCVEDKRFHIGATAISGNHCKIFRERVEAAEGDSEINSMQVFLKDTSTNGTFLNWERLKKNTPKSRLQHGDIISFAAPPHDDRSYAFVYREVPKPVSSANGAIMKRKPEELCSENKRQKGLGIGSLDGPVSLDDVRSLQRSNTELRQQLESHVLTIETLRSENRECISHHENELKELKESISTSYLDQIKESQRALSVKQQELDEFSTLSAELQSSIKDLNERLGASVQSRVDADEIIHSQKATISDLEAQLSEERNQRRGEREKAEADLKSALQRAHSEAEVEVKRQADGFLRQHREQQEVISKLQESERESRLLVETLRSKVGAARESLIISEKKVRQLELHVQDEQTAFANSTKKVETLESELNKLRKELESEKVAREEAWAKVSALELEISAAIRDLSTEKQRFQGARERIILRETQLRAFYSTTEEISALFTKQQEQLKAMQKTLVDEDNCANTSTGFDFNEPSIGNLGHMYTTRAREASDVSTPKNIQAVDISSSNDDSDDDDDDASATERHECDIRNQEGNTQDLECTSADRPAVVPDGDPTDTEPVGETGFDEPNVALHQWGDQAGDTMQLDVETQALENLEPAEKQEDTEAGTVRTTDLLASEAVGSWAVSTAPSVHGENETPRSMDDATAPLVPCSEGEAQGDGSQNNGALKMREEHRALNAMIDIVDPGFRKQFHGGEGSGEGEGDSLSDAETGDGNDPIDASEDDADNGEDETGDESGEDGDEAMVEDSAG